jgi:hypothetical protein
MKGRLYCTIAHRLFLINMMYVPLFVHVYDSEACVFQDLTVTLVSERNTAEVLLVEYDDERSGVSLEDFSAQQEWRLHSVVNIWTKVNTKKVNSNVMKYPGFSVAAKASRRPQFFLWNIITVMVNFRTYSIMCIL